MTNTVATVEAKQTNSMKKYFTPLKVLTLILFIASLIMLCMGIFRNVTALSTFVLGLSVFLNLNKTPETATDLYTSTLLVADASFVFGVFFMLGRVVFGL